MNTNILGAAVCLLLGILSYLIMGLFSGKNHFEVDGRVCLLCSWSEAQLKMLTVSQTVIVTGGSQGMGRGLAKLLAQKGANVVIVARNQRKLSEALKYIAVGIRILD